MKDWKKVLVGPQATVRETIATIDASAMQIAMVVDDAGHLLGTVTDGDVRRGLLRGLSLEDEVRDVMNSNPTRVHHSLDRAEVLSIMRRGGLHQVPVVDDDGLVDGIEVLDSLLEPQERSNWVVLKAGGLGTRLKPLTDTCPKPMLRVGNRPILERILESFIEYGFRNFFMSVNYLADVIEEHFGDGSRWGVRIEYLKEPDRLGTAGALSLLPGRPTEPLLVMNGDLLTQVNFNHLLDFHERQSARATLCVRDYEYRIPYGVVRLDGHRLVGIDEKPLERRFVSAGIYVLNPDTIDLVPDGRYYDMPSLFSDLVEQKQTVSVFPIREYWIDIGRLEDFERANGEIDVDRP